jgi:hypothetical protein
MLNPNRKAYCVLGIICRPCWIYSQILTLGIMQLTIFERYLMAQ